MRHLRVFLVGMAMASCSANERSAPLPSADTSIEWQRVQRNYPFVGDHGELVCNAWTRRSAEGFTEIEQEYYHLDKINDKITGRTLLAGTTSLDKGAREFIKAKGLGHVATCEQAREFMRWQHEYFESFPSMEPEEPLASDDLPAEEAPAERVDKVRDGHFFDHEKTVRLLKWGTTGQIVGTCSGVLINKRTILTAAHCYLHSGLYSISVDYGNEFSTDAANGNWCISSNSPNCLTVMPSQNFRVFRNPAYTGTSDTRDDVAVIVENQDRWRLIGGDEVNFMRLMRSAVGAGVSYWVQGYGAKAHDGSGAGTPRRSNEMEGIAWVGAGYWLSYATHPLGHPCRGDSGSSAVNVTKTPWDVSIGVWSNYDVVGDNHCPQIGDKFRYAGLNDANLSLVENAVQTTGQLPCQNWGYNGWSYKVCF